MKNGIEIIRMQCATIISSHRHFLSYDHRAEGKFVCILNFCPFSYFREAIEDSKIIKVENAFSFQDDAHESCTLILTPLFGYDNQKFEDIIYSIFLKFKL